MFLLGILGCNHDGTPSVGFAALRQEGDMPVRSNVFLTNPRVFCLRIREIVLDAVFLRGASTKCTVH
jgi:hypothetical protein